MIHLSLFGHRFMSIAEQMGRTLQRTAISTNIKVFPKQTREFVLTSSYLGATRLQLRIV